MTDQDWTPDDAMEPAPAPATPAAPRENDGFPGRLADLVAKPSRLMDNVAAASRWWQPLLLNMILIGAFAYVTLPISGPEQLEMMRDSKLMSMMDEAQWQEMYDQSLNKSTGQLIGESVGAAVSTAFMTLVFSFAMAFFVKMGGARQGIWPSVGVVMWSSLLPFGLASLVKLPLVLATESAFTANIGLAALLPGGDPSSALYKVLMTYGDLFTWWGLIVMIIGFVRVQGLSRNGSAATVILPWALMAAIPLGISILFM